MIETILLILTCIGLLFNITKRPKNFPPGPYPLPILGSGLLLDQKKPQRSLDYFHRKYGPYVGLVVLNFNILIINGWEAISEVLGNDNVLGRPDACLIRDRFEGENYGIVFTEGSLWKTQRRFTMHHFRKLGFAKKIHESIIQEESEYMIEIIKGMGGKPFSIEEYILTPVVNMVWCIIANQRFRHSDPQMISISNSVKESMDNINCLGGVSVGIPFLRYLFPERTGYNHIKRSTTNLRNFAKKTIEEHTLTRTQGQPRDFIDAYLDELEKSTEIDETFSHKQLQGLCVDFLIAGDTSVPVLCFVILFLCIRKDVQEKVYKEILEHVGLDRLPGSEDKTNLVWTEAVIMEVLRLRTSTPNTIPHRAEKDLVFKGYNIPKDTVIIPNLMSIFLDPKYFQDPEEFRPERFITPEGKLRKEERLIAFGKGKRNCFGESLARTSSLIFLSSLIQKFSFEFDPNLPQPNTEGVPGFIMKAPFFQVVATPRE